MNEFVKVQPYEAELYTYWISGIYKIVSYESGEFHAFFIQDCFNNWGDYVSTPPANGKRGKIWDSLESAIEACRQHAMKHEPKPKTVKRAAEILASLIEQEKKYLIAA